MRLLSRNDLSLNERYPEVAEALDAQSRRRFAIDGEVVAFDGGRTSFEALARRGRRAVTVYLYVFDVLWLDGRDVRPLPLRERKRLLRDALDFGGPLRLTPHRNERRRGVLRGGLPQGLGGADRQAGGQPVHARPARATG